MNLLSFIIDAKDRFSATFTRAKKEVENMGLTWKGAWDQAKSGNFSGIIAMATKFAPVIGTVTAALKGFSAAWKFVNEGLADNAKLEKMAVRLSVVTGSIQSARAEIEKLTKGKYAVDDLFSEDEIINGVIALRRLSGGILGSAGDMQMLAGVAYATGQSLADVSQSVGMLTSMILGGDSAWGRYAKQLVASGAVSKDVITQMERMQAEGKGAGDVVAYLWANLNGQSPKTLEEARKTLEGIKSAADDAAGDAAKMWATNAEAAAKSYEEVRGGWWRTVEWFGKHPARLGYLIAPFTAMSAGIKEMFYGKDKTALTGGDATSQADIAAKGNAKGAEQAAEKAAIEAAEKEKKTGEKSAEDHAELLKKKEEAQKKFDEAQRTRAQQLAALAEEEKSLQSDMTFNVLKEGTDARIEAETRLLEINAEILKLKKEIAAEDKKKASEESSDRREKSNKESRARSERLVEQSQYKYHSALDKASPEQQMAMIQANIKRWRKNLAEAGTEEEKAAATKGLIAQYQERDRLQKEAAAKEKERAKDTDSLMQRDREIRESKMTPEQRLAESKKRQADLEKKLGTETDPDKQLMLKNKLMDEAEKQVGLEKEKTGRRSISIGDVFEKGYGQRSKKDPAHEQVELSKDIKRLLEKIEKKQGGMTR